MSLIEGQIYEGEVGSFGHEAPLQLWIVVSSFGKLGLHSISDPLDHHFMALTTAQAAIDNGMLAYRETDGSHPAIALQRAKETRNIRDTHMSVCVSGLNKMMALLKEAVVEHPEYAPYLAGEILSMLGRARYRYSDTAPLVERVQMIIGASALPVNLYSLVSGQASIA